MLLNTSSMKCFVPISREPTGAPKNKIKKLKNNYAFDTLNAQT
jgi:hypothetical protein